MREELQVDGELTESEYEWKAMPDWAAFVQNTVGAALIESVFGKTLLDLNPGFVEDAFALDSGIPWLARGLPRWAAPGVWAARDRMIMGVKKWYTVAREGFDGALVDEDGDGDPYWGSELTRYRQRVLSKMPGHDDDVLARNDVGLVWGAVGNTTPAAMMAAYHMFEDRWLLERVRRDVDGGVLQADNSDAATGGTMHTTKFEETVDAKKLSKHSLLSSMYAETLRRYVHTYCMLSSPHSDVSLGKWRLPRREISLSSSGTSQTDPTFWNSRWGMYPVDKFWAERFLIDPEDPDSGPLSRAAKLEDLQLGTASTRTPNKYLVDGKGSSNRADGVSPQGEAKGPFYSLNGTEGSWFPFGGGHSICPGRFFAKNAILFTCAFLAREYDIELLIRADQIKRSSWKFGFGVNPPTHDLPFRVRRRRV